MKITSFYYLEYPDCLPADPLVACSEVYVEVADSDDGNTESFDFTYALTVCTVGFLKGYLETHGCYCARAMLVVETFDDNTIKRALKEILANIEELAIKK